MIRLVVSHEARADLRSIAQYSQATWGKLQSQKYMYAIKSRFKLLQRNPMIGPLRRELGRDYRSLSAGQHAIYYRSSRDRVIIIRVLHQRMDIRAHL